MPQAAHFRDKRKEKRWRISHPPTAMARMKSARPQRARLLIIDVTVITGAKNYLHTHAKHDNNVHAACMHAKIKARVLCACTVQGQ